MPKAASALETRDCGADVFAAALFFVNNGATFATLMGAGAT
eukprot:COSAG06_NODE_51485_length_312_cov_0.333333_1_plen_40_part_01